MQKFGNADSRGRLRAIAFSGIFQLSSVKSDRLTKSLSASKVILFPSLKEHLFYKFIFLSL